MVNVNKRKRCLKDTCMKRPSWGLLAGGAATSCAEHKSNIVDGQVGNFNALRKVAGCGTISTW